MHVALRIDDTLRRAVLLYPDVEAVLENERRWTYRGFQQEVHQLARAMQRLGVVKGDRIAVLSPNTVLQYAKHDVSSPRFRCFTSTTGEPHFPLRQ